MEEARRVLSRLARIESLERAGAAPERLLAEVRGLLPEAEAWARREGAAAAPALVALERCRIALAKRPPGLGARAGLC